MHQRRSQTDTSLSKQTLADSNVSKLKMPQRQRADCFSSALLSFSNHSVPENWPEKAKKRESDLLVVFIASSVNWFEIEPWKKKKTKNLTIHPILQDGKRFETKAAEELRCRSVYAAHTQASLIKRSDRSSANFQNPPPGILPGTRVFPQFGRVR